MVGLAEEVACDRAMEINATVNTKLIAKTGKASAFGLLRAAWQIDVTLQNLYHH
jgi:hypothetical protein